MDRIEYEEWALKGVQEGRGVKIAKEGGVQEKIEVSRIGVCVCLESDAAFGCGCTGLTMGSRTIHPV
jgi:hypothetical protein